jgi:hypothetical protein
MSDVRPNETFPPFQASQFLGYEPISGIRPSVDFGQVVATTMLLLRKNWPGILVFSLIFNFLPQATQPYIGSLDDINGGPWFQIEGTTKSNFGWYDVLILILSTLSSGYVTLLVLAREESQDVGFGKFAQLSWPIISLSLVSSLGITLGLILFVIPGVLLSLAWSVALPVLIAEKLGIVKSLSRSSELTTGSHWQILVAFFGILILNFALGLLGEYIGGFVYDASSFPNSNEVTANFIAAFGEVISTLLIAALYLKLRTYKEGPRLCDVAGVFE